MLNTAGRHKTASGRRRRSTPEELQEKLRQRSTTPQRVKGLLELLSVSLVAKATGVSISTVRNWSAGNGDPRPDAALALDDLRAVAETLLRGGMAPDEVSGWLISRDPNTKLRPIDEIAKRPTEVLAEAVSEVMIPLVSARELASTAS